MSTLLHLAASPRGAASWSRQVGRRLVDALCAARPMRVVARDLCALPVPDGAFAEASLMRPAERGATQRAALALSEALIGELEAADLLVIDTPMHNFTVPAVLKSWIDLVVRPGRTFALTPQGKVGLLRDRPVLVAVASGGRFAEDGRAQRDFLSPYLRYVLGVIGLTDLDLLLMEELRRGGAAEERAMARAEEWIAAQARRWSEA